MSSTVTSSGAIGGRAIIDTCRERHTLNVPEVGRDLCLLRATRSLRGLTARPAAGLDAAAAAFFGDRMPAMRSRHDHHAKVCSSGREWLLAWLVCGGLRARRIAQTDAGAIGPATATPGDATSSPSQTRRTRPTRRELDRRGTCRRRRRQPSSSSRAPSQEFGQKSLQTAEAYIEPRRRATPSEAITSERPRAISRPSRCIAPIDGPFTPLAIAPLTSLGDNYHEANDDVNAVASYTEARTVSRRVYGLHNEAADRAARSHVALAARSEPAGRGRGAAGRSAAPRAAQQSAGRPTPCSRPSISTPSGSATDCMFQLERDQYMRALRIIRAGPWRARRPAGQSRCSASATRIATSAIPRAWASRRSQEALELLLEQPERDPARDRPARCATSAIGPSRSARRAIDGTEYQRAWQMLGSAPNGEQLRREWFSGANYVLYEPISPRGLSTDPEAVSGHVTVTFDIDRARQHQQRDARRIRPRRPQGRSRAAAHSPLAVPAVARQRRGRRR